MQHLTNEVKKQKKEVENISAKIREEVLKQKRMNDVLAATSASVDTIGTPKKALEIIRKYNPNYSNKLLIKYLENTKCLTPEIKIDLYKLEEFYKQKKGSSCSKSQ